MEVSSLKVKIFFNSSHRKLEDELSEWLINNSGAIIEHINQSANQAGHCITLWYKSKY